MIKNPYNLFAVEWQNWLITHFQSIIAAKLIPSKVLCFPQMCTILRRVTSYILGTVWPQKGYVFMHFYWKIKMTKKNEKNLFSLIVDGGHSALSKHSFPCEIGNGRHLEKWLPYWNFSLANQIDFKYPLIPSFWNHALPLKSIDYIQFYEVKNVLLW